MKELERKYGNLNKLIVQKHRNISKERATIIKSRCHETIGLSKNEEANMLSVYLDSVMRKIQLKQKDITEVYDLVLLDLNKEEKSLHDKILSSKEFFERHEKKIGELYSREMNKLFAYEIELDNAALMYFLNSSSASFNQHKHSIKETEKMKNLGQLWDNLIEGDARFNSESGPRSINWSSMKDSLVNSLFVEGL